MSGDADSPITLLLQAVGREEPGSRARLLGVVYEELRRIAARKMAGEAPGHTLQATALVHEAYLRLGGNGGFDYSHRGHFFVAAGEAMRRVLVDSARRSGRLKRGGGARRKVLREDSITETSDGADLIDLDGALTSLESHDAHLAQVVKLRYFAGRSVDETAEALGVSPRKVDKDWKLARAWLHRALTGESPDG